MASLTGVIFRKELTETLRDKRVILGVVVSPLLLTPLLIAAIAFFAGQKSRSLQAATWEVGLVEQGPFPDLVERLEAEPSLSLSRFPSPDDAALALRDLSIRAAVVIPADAAKAFGEGSSAPLTLLFDSANENSTNARSRVRGIVDGFNRDAVAQRLADSGLSPEFIRPVAVEERNVAEQEAMVGFALSLILPYLVVMGAAFGGITTAFDLCAGEKERGTMETLLVSPASRSQIVQGKLLTVFAISMLSAICSVLGIVIVMVFGGQVAKALIGQELAFSYLNLAALVVIVLPLSLLTSAGLLLVSSFARNQKEAQAYIFPVVAVVLFPAILSSILGAESPLYAAFIPILNTALAMKQLLGNVFDLSFFSIAFASSLLYALLGMRIAARLFQREAILFRA